jgi:hypothetical protein
MSQPTAQTTTQRVNSVDVEVPEGKEGWRDYTIDDILIAIETVIKASKEHAMVALRTQSEAAYLVKIMERFDKTPMFCNRINLLKKVALGLDATGKKELGEMLATIFQMQKASSSKAARGIEFDYGQSFNARNAPQLMSEVSPAQKEQARIDFINRTGNNAPGAGPPGTM